MVPVFTQLLQMVFAVAALLLGFRLRPRSRRAGRLCLAGGLVLLAGAAFEILWLTIAGSVFGAGSLPRAIAGAFLVEFVEAVLAGGAWILLVLAALAGRTGTAETWR